MNALHISLLGEFKLEHNGDLIATVNSPRLQSVLAYLLLHSAAPQLRRHVAFQLWPDSSERQAYNNLRKVLHQLRRALSQIGQADPYSPNGWLHTDDQSVQWRPNLPYTVDVTEFETKLRQAQDIAQDDPAALQHILAEAVALYDGDLLSSCYDEWITPLRERLRQAFLESLERLMWLTEDQRDYATAIHYARQLLQHDPLHEATYRRLMRLYMLDGNRASALRAYHTCAILLQRELGVEPGLEIRQAYARLLAMETPSVLRAKPPSDPPRVLRLVGRQAEWKSLRKAWQQAMLGQPYFCMISGEAGIGKTRLAEELAAWVERQGIAVVHTRAYAAEGVLAYAPLIEWLRGTLLPPTGQPLDRVWLTELARLLPELLAVYPGLPSPGSLTERWQRNRLFEALAWALLTTPRKPGLSGKPDLSHHALLLVLDDLQWCDRETLEWLHYFLHYDHQARLLIVGTVRPEEVTGNHPLTTLLLDLRHRGEITEIDLGPLDRTEAAAMAAQLSGQSLNEQAIAQIYQITEGNPFFIIEMIRSNVWQVAQMPDQPAPTQSVAPSSLPPKVYATIQQQLAQLSPTAHDLVCLAAVIGHSFTLPVLAHASGLAEERLVCGLDELWQRRILRSQANDRYDFTRNCIREVAYCEVSPIRRQHLHKCVAQALDSLYPDQRDSQGRVTLPDR